MRKATRGSRGIGSEERKGDSQREARKVTCFLHAVLLICSGDLFSSHIQALGIDIHHIATAVEVQKWSSNCLVGVKVSDYAISTSPFEDLDLRIQQRQIKSQTARPEVL